MKILDCTLRDGGYYTAWDFDSSLVDQYINDINHLPIDIVEIGYRSPKQKDYLGEYFYCANYLINHISEISQKELAIILNEKDVSIGQLNELLQPCMGKVAWVRIAIDPLNLTRAVELAKEIKKLGFKVAFNVMYMSSWKQNETLLDQLSAVNDVADVFYMVDSYGGVYPNELKEIYNLITSKLTIPIGFHGHNNLELALINTLTALECGVEYIDATILGMGRGAGNLKTELLLTSLYSQEKVSFDFNTLSSVVDAFSGLLEKYKWGTSLPYMVSGANSLPQKEVMEWVSNRFYSFNSIIRALNNKSQGVKDNVSLEVFNFDSVTKTDSVLVIAGGEEAVKHSKAIHEFLLKNKDITVIHASSKFAKTFRKLPNTQIYCLVGNEGHRLASAFDGDLTSVNVCILPPYPRKMGTYIPNDILNNCYELANVEFSNLFQDSHTAIALQTAINLGVTNILVVGYDGYADDLMDHRKKTLFNENEFLFMKVKEKGIQIISLTKTAYTNLEKGSIYTMI